MLIDKLWTMRITGMLGCLVLLACTIGSAMLLIPRSWRDLDDANVRMHLFRFHVYDPDFIAAAVGFAVALITVASMAAVCLWMCWLLVTRWNMSAGKDEKQG